MVGGRDVVYKVFGEVSCSSFATRLFLTIVRINRPSQKVRLNSYLLFRYFVREDFYFLIPILSSRMILSTIAALLVIVAKTSARDVPNYLHICRRNDPKIDDCMVQSVKNLGPTLKTGDPELNIPSLEPFYLKELPTVKTPGLEIIAKDVRTYGASNFIISRMKSDFQKLRFEIDIDLPHLYIEGMYQVDGKVLLLPVTGSGPMRGNFTNCKGTVRMQSELRKDKNGEEHMRYSEFRMKISIGKGNLQLDNLFGGDKTLGDVVNSAINDNFDAFIKELKPLIEKALSEAFLKIANNIVEPFTFNQLFPVD